MNEIFRKARITVTKDNKQKLDEVVHHLVKVNYKNCPQAWKEVKKRIAEDEQGFIIQLKAAWDKRH